MSLTRPKLLKIQLFSGISATPDFTTEEGLWMGQKRSSQGNGRNDIFDAEICSECPCINKITHCIQCKLRRKLHTKSILLQHIKRVTPILSGMPGDNYHPVLSAAIQMNTCYPYLWKSAVYKRPVLLYFFPHSAGHHAACLIKPEERHPLMKTLLRSSIVTLLLVGSYAGISASANVSSTSRTPNLGIPGAPRPDQCNCQPIPTSPSTTSYR